MLKKTETRLSVSTQIIYRQQTQNILKVTNMEKAVDRATSKKNSVR